jgi:hypothetical protein
VAGAREEIDVQGADVELLVGRRLRGIEKDRDAGLVHHLDRAPRIDRGAVEVRGHDHGDELHGRREGRTKRFQVSERHGPMRDSVARELLPGQKIAVVLLVGRHDHVARDERKGMGDEIDRMRGVLGENDLLDAAGMQEPAAGVPRQRHSSSTRRPRRCRLRSRRPVLGVVGRDRVDHRLRPERHAGVVEIDGGRRAGAEVAPQPVEDRRSRAVGSERPVTASPSASGDTTTGDPSMKKVGVP